MKRFVISTILAFSAGLAHADPVTVIAPQPGASAEEKTAYLIKLEKAVKEVCYEASTPVVGVNYYAYLACLKRTRQSVGETEPTGLYVQRDWGGDAIAAK